jgi:hypothetical protein
VPSKRNQWYPLTRVAKYHDGLGISPDFELFTEGYSWDDLITSQDHPAWPPERGSTGDIGGDFLVVKREYEDTGSEQEYDVVSGWQYWIGRQFAHAESVSDSTFPVVVPTSQAELEAMATSTIAHILPTNPLSNLSQFLGELREGIPSLPGIRSWRNRAQVARSAGDEYLNAQFGWLPLISDLKKFNNAVTNSDVYLRRYEADSGKLLRRRVELIDESDTDKSVESGVGVFPTPAPPFAMPFDLYDSLTGEKETYTTTRRKVWLSAAFTYYLPPYKPDESNLIRNEQLTNYLYGTRPTPEVLWNLAPWTWAADWFGNFGDIIHNVSAFQSDGLVMPFAYIMETKSVDVYHRIQRGFTSFPTATFTQGFKTTTKQRVKATPYGFGLDLGSLTDRQWAIITALGLTKSRTQLKFD